MPHRRLVVIFLMPYYWFRNKIIKWEDIPEEFVLGVNNLQNLLVEAMNGCQAQGDSSGTVMIKDEPLDIEVKINQTKIPEISK